MTVLAEPLSRSVRRQAKHRRPRSARFWQAVVVVGALLVVAGAQLVNLSPRAPSAQRPTLSQLDAAVALSERYLDGLYKPLPGGGAVQSEDYGFPLRVYFPASARWVLLGEGKPGQCLGSSCDGPTSISPGPSSATSEQFRVTFDSPAVHDAVRLSVGVDWESTMNGFAVTVTGSTADPASPVEVFLDTTSLVSLPPSGASVTKSTTIPLGRVAVLRSLRYTVRHATQEAYLYWRARGDQARADALAGFLTANGYRPGVDIRAAIFGTSRGLPDDLPYVASGADDMYEDCDHLPSGTAVAYPYHSKVCLLGVHTFTAAAKSDPFTQAAEALAVLTNHDNPDYQYSTGGSGVLRPALSSPRQVARELERLWDDVGNGEPACKPDGCDTKRASALRTFHFGVLEAVLGYRYHDARSVRYADAAAAAALRAQVKADGELHFVARSAYRPAQVGGFPIYWDDQGRFVPDSGLTKLANDRLSMPPEYAGQVPSDSETTFDGWAFLTAYRCLADASGCSVTAWRG